MDVGGAQTLKADYKANTTQLFAELGYQVPVGASSSVEPYAGLAWFNNHSDSFDEDGGPAALHGSGQTDQITTFTLGLRGNTALQLGATETRLSAGLGWRHANGDVDATRKLAFIQGGGTAFTVAGSPVAREAAVLDLAAEVDVGRNAALGLAYGGQFGNGNKENTGSLYLKVRF
ncbi:serine protease [Bordetella pertussis]|nr:serine protease [Bordetella pertussis]CPO69228.1 serine protease [Bordetella pertussis]